MARQNIFELIAQKTDVTIECRRMIKLFSQENTIVHDSVYMRGYTIRDFLEKFSFNSWRGRGHVTGLEEFLQMTGYNALAQKSRYTVDDFVSLAEILLNLWKVVDEHHKASYTYLPNYNLLYRIIIDNLKVYNQKAIYDAENGYFLIIEDKPEVTAVAEIVDESTAFEVLRYNHRELKGNIQAKKEALLNIGAYLESREKELINVDNTLKKAIFHILNTMGIRHMNAENEANILKVGNDLEYWYDELYQMMLLAVLRMDNVERMEKYNQELKPLLK